MLPTSLRKSFADMLSVASDTREMLEGMTIG